MKSNKNIKKNNYKFIKIEFNININYIKIFKNQFLDFNLVKNNKLKKYLKFIIMLNI